jgi:N-acetylglucosamine-6-phosphate deacetylase
MDPALPDGHYPWRSLEHTIEKKGNSITLSGTDTLAGAAVSLDECVRNLSTFCSIPLSRAIHHATRTPAKVLGPKVESRKGALRVGWDADLCVWDRFTGKVLSTWQGGKQVFGDLAMS